MEEIKRNPLPKLECGMAYLAHPYSPIIENLKVFTGFVRVMAAEQGLHVRIRLFKGEGNQDL